MTTMKNTKHLKPVCPFTYLAINESRPPLLEHQER